MSIKQNLKRDRLSEEKHKTIWESLRKLVANVFDCDTVVMNSNSSCANTFTFRIIPFRKGMNLLITQLLEETV